MAYFSAEKKIERKDIGELVDGNQVYDIIQDTVDYNREFYAIEPAIVNKVYFDPTDKAFPKVEIKDGTKLPDYSVLGTIDAVFSKSGDTISKVKPVSLHMIVYPDEGEVVNIAKYANEYYWYMPLNIFGRVNINLAYNKLGTISNEATKFNRKLFPEPGDVIVQGRFGQSIRLGSDTSHEFPIIRIACGQSQTVANIRAKNVSSFFPQIEDLNNDGSTIHLSSGPERVQFVPSAEASNIPMGSDGNPFLIGNQIIMNSDRLIFNSKSSETSKYGGLIHLLASNKITLAATGGVYIETGKDGMISLGTDADLDQNPLVKGKELKDLLVEILDAIEAFAEALSKPELEGTNIVPALNTAASSLLAELEESEMNIPKIFSRTNFTI
jgi:hypothetical protein